MAATSSAATAIPQILSRSVVPQLSEGLDAGDILECYALVRRAPLHNGKLEAQGILNETLFIFTTDNGFYHGEHGLAGKWYPHEESIRTPLIVWDPRMPINKRGTTEDAITLNVDLAPTILGAANVSVPSVMQGRDVSDLYLKQNANFHGEQNSFTSIPPFLARVLYRDPLPWFGKTSRGERSVANPTIFAPEPDLLKFDTYEDASALEYFQCLEQRLKGATDARPSLGHIATPDEIEASKWGEAVSVWPIGTSLSYVWPVQDTTFFPTSSKCPSDNIAINHDLAMALERGHEVLFASEFDNNNNKRDCLPLGLHKKTKSAFLGVPKRFESALLQLIKQPCFTDG